MILTREKALSDKAFEGSRLCGSRGSIEYNYGPNLINLQFIYYQGHGYLKADFESFGIT